MNLLRATLLAILIATTNHASAEIDASQADARLIGMPIYTSDGLLIGQVTGIEPFSSRRSLVGDIATPMGFGLTRVWIPLSWANKGEDHIVLLISTEQIATFLAPGRGIGSR